MKIFIAEGKLGNQIFQYAFLKTIKKNNEKIVVSGFECLKEVFEIDDVLIFKRNRWLRAFIFRICKPILIFLSDKKIISRISINHEKVLGKYTRESVIYTEELGFFRFITFVNLGFFQSEKFFDRKLAKKLKIKINYSKEADNYLESIPKNMHKVFIHIRKGDYINYIVYGKSTLLPISYFTQQIEWFLKNRKKPFFIFLSDEPKFIEKEFYFIKNKLISMNKHYGTDLAIMTKCHSAILSPSSFGWWGSYLMEYRDTVFVPEYWLGFNSMTEYQKGTTPSFSQEISI